MCQEQTRHLISIRQLESLIINQPDLQKHTHLKINIEPYLRESQRHCQINLLMRPQTNNSPNHTYHKAQWGLVA